MPCSYVVYVDEAGDEGFSFKSGSSEWFVLSAVLTLKAEDLETVKLVDEGYGLKFWPREIRNRLPWFREVFEEEE
jgi:uncharacterized protein DUF3800